MPRLATTILWPVLKSLLLLSFDPIWFGIIVTKTVEIGALTPLVGINAFVVKEASNELTLSDVFKGCAPFVVLEILIVVILVIFPQIAYYGK